MENTSSTSEEENRKIIKLIDFLGNLSSDEILTNPRAFNSLYILRYSIPNLKSYEIFIEKNFQYLLSEILSDIYNKRLTIKFTNLKGSFDISQISCPYERKISIIYLCLMIINIISYDSIYFMRKFFSIKGLEVHLKFLEDLNLVKQLSRLNISDKKNFNYTIIELLVINLNRFSSHSEYLNKWGEFSAIKILFTVPSILNCIKTDVFLTIANVICDKQTEYFEKIREIIFYIQTILSKASEDFKNKKFTRQTMRIIENDKFRDIDIHCVIDNEVLKPISNYLKALYRLAIIDEFKNDIYFQNSFYQDLKFILLNGNSTEIIYALKLYAQLSFNSKISKNLSEQQDFLEYLANLKYKSNAGDKLVVKLCDLLLWNLDHSNIHSEKKANDHIMISFSSSMRKSCLRIKTKLELLGYKVWIDDENNKESSLASITKGVNDCYCVLACVTENYRESIKCQAEIKYAQKLNKRIIPLIMQKGYENFQGWLRKIFTTNDCINFTMLNFDEFIEKIKKEIKNRHH